jgi:hypothetical protein
VDPSTQPLVRGISLRNQTMTVILLVLDEAIKHLVPLLIVVALHLILDLCEEANELVDCSAT